MGDVSGAYIDGIGGLVHVTGSNYDMTSSDQGKCNHSHQHQLPHFQGVHFRLHVGAASANHNLPIDHCLNHFLNLYRIVMVSPIQE